MTAANSAFLLVDNQAKLAADRPQIGEIIFIRGLVAFLLTGALAVCFNLHRTRPTDLRGDRLSMTGTLT